MFYLLAAVTLSGSPLQGKVNVRFKQQEKYKESVIEAKTWIDRVYLATYPRSGNHWMRYLIEEASGIATSSVYRDAGHPYLREIFPWGGFSCEQGYEGNARYPVMGESFVVKTHFPSVQRSPFDQLPYVKAVRIVRHPVDSFYSYYLYEKDRAKTTPPDYFMPRKRLVNYIRSWGQFMRYWDLGENVLTVRYEDLYRNPALYLKQILDFIGYAVTDEDVARAVAKYPPIGGVLKHLEHFTEEDLELIQGGLGDLLNAYDYEVNQVNYSLE